MPRPLAAFDLKAYQVLCKIDAQLRIAGNNLNQMKKACNSAVALGKPVVVNAVLALLNKGMNGRFRNC